MPNAAPADNAPIKIVSGTDTYHFCPPTQLLASPNTPSITTAAARVEYRMASSILEWPRILAMMEGMMGARPKMLKLKKVTMLFLMGFYSPAMRCNSSIIMIFRKPSLLRDSISTIYFDT